MNKGTKGLAFYLLIIAIFGSLMYFIVEKGENQQPAEVTTSLTNAPDTLGEGFTVFGQLLVNNVNSSIGILLLQIIVILLACRLFGWLFKKIGQPTVVGEIIAGIVLGPSILGNLAPEMSAFLFREESLDNISILSQFGLILFMFTIGMELDIEEVRRKLKETILISHTNTIIPFFLGMLTAYFLYDNYAGNDTPFLSFALFIGIAMSITAFPVLARIIQEKKLTKSHLGTITLASAANGDITAWCLLAVVVGIAQAGTILSAIYSIFFSGVYIAVMFFLVRPLLKMVGHIYHNKEVVDKGLVALMFFILITSSYLTEILGLHALFGAFIAGVVMPANIKFRKIMSEKVEDVSLSLFLPLFFASTGLRTEIGLLNTPELWEMCAVCIAMAILGKFGGSFIAARFVGESVKNSLYIGALMNTRGLMELVVLTIGYEMGILPPPVFVMLIIMTLVTTFMTAPLISLIKFCYRKRDAALQKHMQQPQQGLFKVLLSFGRAGSGQVMLDAAHQMFSKGDGKLEITALHLTVGTDINPLQTENFEDVSFEPILAAAQKLGISIITRYEVSNNPAQDIIRIVNEEKFDFLLVGAALSLSNLPADVLVNRFRESFSKRYAGNLKTIKSLFSPGYLLKDKTKVFIDHSQCPVGVFINRNFTKASRIVLLLSFEEDAFLLDYARTLMKCTGGSMDTVNMNTAEMQALPSVLREYDFMMISYRAWSELPESRIDTLKQVIPSTLILNKPGLVHKNNF